MAVQLFEVDANAAEKLEQLRPNRCARGVGHANARQPHGIAQRAVNHEVAQAVLEFVQRPNRLAIQNV